MTYNQIKRDSETGKLDFLIKEALEEKRNGTLTGKISEKILT